MMGIRSKNFDDESLQISQHPSAVPSENLVAIREKIETDSESSWDQEELAIGMNQMQTFKSIKTENLEEEHKQVNTAL